MGDMSTFLDSVLLSCNIFVLGAAVGAFLSYHYLCKGSGPRVMITSDDISNSSHSGWRSSNPDELAVERPADQNNRRRRSSLYH